MKFMYNIGMKTYDVMITCASGVEGILKKELRGLGFFDTKAVDGKITLTATSTDIARFNMFLNTAERVLIVLKSFYADTFDMLYDGIKSIPFGDIFPYNARIIVNGKSKKSKLFALSSCQSIIKKAIVSTLVDRYHRHIFPETGETYRFEFFINNDIVTFALDTSGSGLHKRGYRDLVSEAPIKETLASSMLLLSDFSSDRAFVDPFCGSGTIAIEATRLALNIAPGKLRDFDYKKWDFFDSNTYDLALQEALDKETLDKKLRFSAFDIDKNAISLAMRHAKRAGVDKYLHIQTQDVKDLRSRYAGGTIVTNPPYGERLLEKKDAEKLYSTLGTVWKNLDDWSIFVITACDTFEKAFGKKSDKNRKFFNANLTCHYYQYFHSAWSGKECPCMHQ